MKKLIFILALVTVIISGTILSGCVRVDLAEKNGPITTREYNFTDFTGINIGYAFDFEVTPSDTYKVSITAGENVLEHIDVHKDGSTLVIEVNDWFFQWFSSPKVTITMPVLNELKLSGAARGSARGFKSSQDFDLQLSGATELDIAMETGDFVSELSGASRVIGSLTATSSDIELSGASRIELTGSGWNINLHGSGASNADLIGFAVNDADIEFSGASHASLDISGRVDVDLSGASSLEYTGNPTLGIIDITGASSMNKRTLQ
jgi:hypothetical protein